MTKKLARTLPPTYLMPTLQNNDAYRQYRHVVAMASARAMAENGDHMDPSSSWGENQSVVCYTEADKETLMMANEILGVTSIALTDEPSTESPLRNTVSPVRPFVDITESERMRSTIDSVNNVETQRKMT